MFNFNVRVYGILKDSNNRVLVADEFIRGDFFTKFPGGGLEFGEGTRECLKREFMEETMLDVIVGDHIYTTDHFQMSAFNKDHQIISIYYFVHTTEPINLETKTKLFDFLPEQLTDNTKEYEVFRWLEWEDFTEENVTLPLDKIAVRLVRELHDKAQHRPPHSLLVRSL